MPHDDRQLIVQEVDAIFGLAPGADGAGHVLLDRSKKAVFAWSPADRVFALSPDVGVDVAESAAGRRARRLRRPDNWGPDEWPDLIEGRLGAWAMAVRDADPVAICFTPAANARVAEAGVWTRPDHRGHGLASAVIWAWAEHERPTGRTLLYSTWADNTASQAVARKMGLPPLGWIWVVR